MTGPANAGLFLYAKDLDALAGFYETVLGMSRLHASGEMVVLQSSDVQLVVHRIPAHIAAEIAIASPPVPREDCAMKFFFTVPGIDDLRPIVAGLGGTVMDTLYRGPGFHACNACDPEGNIFQVRQGV